jgi:general secretion pathway protein G
MTHYPGWAGLDKAGGTAFKSLTMKPASRVSPFRSRRGAEAFTLLEILVVLAIIGLLASLVITNVGGIFGSKQKDVTKLFVTQSIQLPLTAYKIDMGDYPTTAEGLQALVTQPANKADRWRGPYLQDAKLPVDTWGEPYQYRFPGTHNKNGYDVWSKGPDKTDGTEDDIGNW